MSRFTIGSIKVERGSRGYGTLPVTKMSPGFEVKIPIHVIAGHEPGPTVALIPVLHGHEFSVINIINETLKQIKPQTLKGNIIATTITNPLAFQMGTRSSWFDGFWGPTNDLNRAFPGNPKGWIVERIAHIISEKIIPKTDVVLDFHGDATHRFGAAYYAYSQTSPGKLGALIDEFTRDLGLEIILKLGNPRPSSLTGHVRNQEKIGISIEVCDFWGIQSEPIRVEPKRTLTEAGFTCVTNTLKKLGMLEGKLVLPKKQVFLEAGYTGVASESGGLLIPEVTRKDIGRVFNREKFLGKVIDPFKFEVLDELPMPYDETVVLAVKDWRPFTHIEPGGSDVAFGVSDWSKKSLISRTEKEGTIID